MKKIRNLMVAIALMVVAMGTASSAASLMVLSTAGGGSSFQAKLSNTSTIKRFGAVSINGCDGSYRFKKELVSKGGILNPYPKDGFCYYVSTKSGAGYDHVKANGYIYNSTVVYSGVADSTSVILK